jgi:hypothetical protein
MTFLSLPSSFLSSLCRASALPPELGPRRSQGGGHGGPPLRRAGPGSKGRTLGAVFVPPGTFECSERIHSLAGVLDRLQPLLLDPEARTP